MSLFPLPPYYIQGKPITPNLGLGLWGMDDVIAANFVKLDEAFESISGSVNVNGVAVPKPNFIDSATAIFSVTGSNISITAQSFPAVAHEWLNSYSAVTGLFTATQPAASDLSNGTTGTGAVVLASAISGFGSGTVTSVSFTGGLISVATPTTTPALTVAGTSGGIPYFSTATTWASSAILPAGDFVLGGGAGAAPTASFSIVPVSNGGTGAGSTLVGIVRGGNPFTASEISGDATTSGSNALTLATVNANVGSFTNANITVNAKGLITAAANGTAGGGVTSVTNSDGTLTISPTTGAVIASINLAQANTWTSTQTLTVDALIHTLTVGIGGGASSTKDTALGYQALFSNTNGADNSAVGYQALYTNIIGTNNTAVGMQALYFNTSSFNTALGYRSLYNNTSGIDNVAVGYQALFTHTTGFSNVAVGLDALYSNTSGGQNVALGFQAGYTATGGNANVTGSNNTWVGYQSGPGTSTQLSNSTALGYQALNTASNQVSLGNSSVTSVVINGALSGGTTSNFSTGYQIGGAAASGNYLRGNGTNFISSAIQSGDLPSITTLGTITSYGGNTTTKAGIPSVLATSFLTGQTSAISGQSIVSSASAFANGMWRISFVATQTTAGSVGTVLGGTTGFTITFVNANGDTVTKTTALSAPATGVGTSTSDTISGDFYGYAGASTNITYSFGYTAGGITGGAFDIAVYAEYLG